MGFVRCMLSAAALLLTADLHARTAADTPTEPASVQARIARVEQGLSTRVVIQGAPPQHMRLTERMAFHRVPAVSIALINNGRIEWARAYGVLDAGGQRPASPTTLFQAASVSKPVTAMAALHLVEQHALSLDDDANPQLHAWKIPVNPFTQASPVTLRRLLNHSAGTTVHGYYGYAQGQPIPSLLQVLDGVPPSNSDPVRVDVSPGTLWRYSGGGYSVVQLMMTEATSQPFAELMQRVVLGPLGMRDSTFAQVLPPAWQARAASGHRDDGNAVPGQWHIYPESAAAGLWTTPSDLARLVVEIEQAQPGRNGKVVSGAMTATMLTRGLGEYGLGMFVEPLGQGTSFGHSGGTDGFRARLQGYTHTGQGVVVMTNSDNGAALMDEILTSIAAEYHWPEFGIIEKAAIAADARINAALAGDYMLLDKPAHIVAEGEQLYFQSELFGSRRMPLFAESDARFFTTAEEMTLAFSRSDDGTPTGFTLIRGANSYPGVRVGVH